MTDDIQTLPARRRWRRNPFVRVALLFLFGTALFTLGDALWPRDDGIAWGNNVLTALVISTGIVAGSFVAERRYGREALRDEKHPQWKAAMWTEVGVFALIAAVAILIQQLFS